MGGMQFLLRILMFLQKECHLGQQRGCGRRDSQEIIRKTLLVAGALPSVQFC